MDVLWIPKNKMTGSQFRAINSIWDMFPIGDVPKSRVKMLSAIKRMKIRPGVRRGYGEQSHRFILKLLESQK